MNSPSLRLLFQVESCLGSAVSVKLDEISTLEILGTQSSAEGQF